MLGMELRAKLTQPLEHLQPMKTVLFHFARTYRVQALACRMFRVRRLTANENKLKLEL